MYAASIRKIHTMMLLGCVIRLGVLKYTNVMKSIRNREANLWTCMTLERSGPRASCSSWKASHVYWTSIWYSLTNCLDDISQWFEY